MEKLYSVYIHRNKINNKVYVGMAYNPLKRWGKDGIGYHQHDLFFKDINEIGWDNFEHEIIYTDLPMKQAEEKERLLIAQYDSTNPQKGYNLGLGGVFGHKASQETRKKISEAGKRRFEKPEEHEKLSRAAIKRNQDPVKFNKICEGNRNRWKRDEERTKVSEALKSYYEDNPQRKEEISKERKAFFEAHPEKKTTKRVAQIKNGEVVKIWDSLTEAGEQCGIELRNISAVCRGRRKTAGGYIWRLV